MFKAPVVTINTQEGAAYGVALLAATSAGAFERVEDVGKAIRITSTARPKKAASAVYDRMYPEYRGLYRSLKDDFRRIAELQEQAK